MPRPEHLHDAPATGIQVTAASFAYDGHTVLRDIDVELRPGSLTYLIGPNGSGKSTLLRALAGLLEPVAGTVTVHGSPAARHRGRTAFVLQSPGTDWRVPISVEELVMMGRYPLVGLVRRLRRTDHDAVAHALERMDIAALATSQLHDLSGGQRQRAFIAQALAQDADVLLLDEPFIALDPPSRQLLRDVLQAERDEGGTVVVSTHELADASTGDDVLLLAGHAAAFGPPSEVLEPAVLASAYGGRIVELPDGTVLLDDGVHHHEHHAHG